MICIKNKKNQEIMIRGHANQAEYGQDIVCASVSTAVIMTINQIEIFGKLDLIDYELKEGFSRITVKSDDEVIRKIYDNLLFTLRNLEKEYPKYIKINEII